VRSAPGWYTVVAEPGSRLIALPASVSLDLGAVGKAWAADRAAAAAAARIGSGVMVGCGGDVAVAGPPPDGGWPVRVAEHVGAQDWQDINVFDGGVATSGTSARSWRRGGRVYHHILNPSTGLPADTPWRLVTVAAASCAQANAAATAAVIRGSDGPDWLNGLGLPARLIAFDGRTVTVGSWPGDG
jgi:thiamine biosynthesis lipoprotein ApbE